MRRAFTAARKLEISDVPTEAQVEIRCRGKGCPFKKKVMKVPGQDLSVVDATAPFRKRRLKPGVVIKVVITAPGMVGRLVRYTIRDRRPPRKTTLCLPPGQSKPQPC